MEAAIGAIEPGKRDSDITAVARRAGQELGSESGILLCGSAAPGQPGDDRQPAPAAPRDPAG